MKKHRFTTAQLRRLCTGKPTPARGYHPSHRCKDVYLASPTGGFVPHYALNPAELKSRLAWHKDAMKEWIADPHKRALLEREVLANLHPSREDAIRNASEWTTTKFIEGGHLFFVSRNSATLGGGVNISQL